VVTIVYDTGALLAAERRNPDFLALHDELTAARIRPIVPVVVLAQAWRGGLQHQISRVLKACDVIPDDERTGRAAGLACAASGTADVVDAIGLPLPSATKAPVVTSDPGDLTHIADAIGVKIRLYPMWPITDTWQLRVDDKPAQIEYALLVDGEFAAAERRRTASSGAS
jgi:hypothetical protein